MEINPILLRYIRSELRLSKFLPLLIIVIILSAFAAVLSAVTVLPYYGFKQEEVAEGHLQFVLFIQISLLIVGGTKIFSSSIKINSSGILDFHRISPLSSNKLALGVLFGTPLKQVALTILGIPFALYLSLFIPRTGLSLILLKYLHIFAITFCIYAVVLNTALAIKNSFWAGIWLLYIYSKIFIFSLNDFQLFQMLSNSFFSGYEITREDPLLFYGYEVNSFFIFLIQYLPVFGFAFFSAARLLDSNLNTVLGRKASLVLYIYLLFITIGYLPNFDLLALSNYDNDDTLYFDKREQFNSLLCMLIFVAPILLSSINTPSRIKYIRGFIKEKYSKRKQSFFLEYFSSNLYPYLFFAGHFLFALLIELQIVVFPDSLKSFFSSALESTLFCLIFYQLLIFCKIRYEKAQASIFYVLFSFLYIFLPLILAGIVLPFIATLSPVMLLTGGIEFGVNGWRVGIFAIHTIAFLGLYLLTKNEETKIKKSLLTES